MRDRLSECLVDAANQDERIVLLTGDHGYALFDEFRRVHPDKYLNAGIAEQNMVGMAAGLARAGFKPIVYGLSAFVPVRVLEQIKLDIAHDQLPVLLLGDGAGFVYSHLGTSHQSTEDIACLRAIPNVSVFSPADAFELEACFKCAVEARSTSYLRIGKADRAQVHQEPLEHYKLGDLLSVKTFDMPDILFMATGSMVSVASRVASQFDGSAVLSVPTIKPLSIPDVLSAIAGVKVVFTMEEHSVYGGLGSLIAEIASEHRPVRVVRIGVNDRFSKNCGSYDYLLGEHGLDDCSITKRIKDVLKEL